MRVETIKLTKRTQFARNLRISKRSLCELKDALRSAEQKEFATSADLVAGRKLIARIFPPLDRLIAYLERNPKQRNRPPFNQSSDDGGFYFRID